MKRKGCLYTLLAVLLVPMLLFILISQFSPFPMALLARNLIHLAKYGEPDNIEAVQNNVSVVYDLTFGGNVLDIYYPTDAEAPLPVVLYIHGGGFVGGDKSAVQTFAMTIANEGYLVANMNYALAPENPYPAAITQVNQALAYLSDHAAEYGGDMDALFIAGNSAGAHLTSQMAAIISNEAYAVEVGLDPAVSAEQLRGVVLNNGIYDMQTLRATGFTNIGAYLWAYTGERQFETYARIDEISVINHVTPDYPPVFITAGDADPLQSQTLEMIDILEDNDIDVTSVLFTDSNLDHDFILNLNTADAQETFSQLITFLRQYVRRTQ